MSRYSKFTAVIAAGVVACVPVALPAVAQADDSQYAPTMLILDASGSMQRPDPAGTMMDAAKNAVRTFVESAPAAAKVGLTTYGTGTGNTEAEKAAGCRDVSVLRQPDTIDRSALIGAVDGIQPRGWTPMGVSLREAARALPDSGPRSIVLVSDGDDTCSPPDPCDVARELKQQGLDLVVHTIGFAVADTARAQLRCMAEATGGTYNDAADGPALKEILPRVSTAALRNYRASGTPITGAGNYAGAPVAGAGHYLDTIGQGETRYYAVDVPAGATAYFTGIVSFPRVPGVSVTDDFNTLQSRVYGRDGEDCLAIETEQASKSSDGVALTITQTWEGATKQRTGGSSDKCKGDGRYYFALTWDRVSDGVPPRLPLELIIGVEPGVTDPGPAGVTTQTALVEPSGPGTPVTGAGSFTEAVTLDGSGRYSDTLRPGEYVFYRVRLDWGRGLAYRVHFEENGGQGLDVISNIATTLYSPLGEEIDFDTAAYTGRAGVLPTSDPAIATTPIRYANRDANDSAVRKQSVAGWYYIAVKLGSTFTEGGATPVPIRLDLTVAGNPEPGPTYTTNGGVFGEDAGPNGKPIAITADGADEDSSQTMWVVIGAVIVVGVAVLAGIIGLALARRRR
ncbi:vWA domain-containing protein [Nocardia lijiangensis]|uniref:vWA domain-containing protein n=1 Tax=Nocardia lijiangensis TaxID=299618 RepID=UPI00083033FA|nr:VWA domain-containing protein [Nocardia lijiangensis]